MLLKLDKGAIKHRTVKNVREIIDRPINLTIDKNVGQIILPLIADAISKTAFGRAMRPTVNVEILVKYLKRLSGLPCIAYLMKAVRQ